ncbi:MAG TPA: hypothetical protein VHZ03_14835 [Trebonia sp.]|nr:hypothetical protein [Trebonia sp.]
MEVKEAPTRGLRAVFAGFGRALGGRRKGASAPAAEAKPAGDGGHVKVVAPEVAEAEAATPESATPETAAAVAVAADAAAPEAEPQAAAAKTAPAKTVPAKTVPAKTVPAKTAAAKTVPAETVPAKTAAAETATPAAGASGELPLANYDTLTVASLRARLRTLTVPQLRILLDYEKAHQGREEVSGMFERRIAKIVAGETTSFPVVS